MALDDATADLVARTRASWGRPLHEMSLEQARELCQPAAATASPAGRAARVTCAGGALQARVYLPAGEPRAVMVFFHAGGWALGGLRESAALSGVLALRTRCVVVAVGYRCAPEYRFPTAVQDAWTALEWAAGHREEIAGAQVPLIVAGEGAGGNLAAVIARWSFERGGPAVDAQVLICPVTDSDTGSLSYLDASNQLLVDRDAMIWFWDMYAPDAAARKHPDASPLQAMFLTGSPPAVVLTAEHDVVRDEGELYAMRLVQAGVPVEHRRFAGQPHGFAGMMDGQGRAEALDFITAALDRGMGQRGAAGNPPRRSGLPGAS
ncbi:MAG TPA: alpha/beta hydrolase [Streptosporangiaceae bacterium]